NAFIGGCDGVSAVESARFLNESPVGTMSHSLILVIGDEIEAFKDFDDVIDKDIKRIALIDTFSDEKFGAIKAVEALGEKLFAVRLDTPRSRRGDFINIMEEVRWELDLRGFKDVKIFISGGIDEDKIWKYNKYAGAYGVGTAISNAPVIDFSFDIVEVEGESVGKRGKKSGAKQVWRCLSCLSDVILPERAEPEKCECGKKMVPLLRKYLKNGKISKKLLSPRDIRSYVLAQLEKYELEL
ncbi:MAG: nicotinate phosphoribosyltransferase, partial [Actinomycetia bacterium]|nr:nicotinate phosphoribosyltransferase [Actinomycetes bacterium]